MVANLLTELSDALKVANPFYLEGFTNTRKIDGKVMSGDGRERSYKGIDDRKGKYFYIRLNDDTELLYSESEIQFSSCDINYNVVIPLRIVSVTGGIDLLKLERKLRNDLTNITWVGDDYQSSICVELKSAVVDPIKVYQSETGKEELKGNLGLLAIDFELKYRYNNTNCLTIQDLCNDLLC